MRLPTIKVCGSLSFRTLLGGLFIRYFVTGTAGLLAGANGKSVEADFNKSIMTCIHHERWVFWGSLDGCPAREVTRLAWGAPGEPGASGPELRGGCGMEISVPAGSAQRASQVTFSGLDSENTSGSPSPPPRLPNAQGQRGGTRRQAAQAPEGPRTRLAPSAAPEEVVPLLRAGSAGRRIKSAARRPKTSLSSLGASLDLVAPADIGDGAPRLRLGPRSCGVGLLMPSPRTDLRCARS